MWKWFKEYMSLLFPTAEEDGYKYKGSSTEFGDRYENARFAIVRAETLEELALAIPRIRLLTVCMETQGDGNMVRELNAMFEIKQKDLALMARQDLREQYGHLEGAEDVIPEEV